MTTEPKHRTIVLTDRPPVRIREDAWRVVGSAGFATHDGKVRCQANRTWAADMWVRQHAGGRTLVYGVYNFSSAWRGEPDVNAACGVLLPAGADVAAAVREVAGQLAERGLDADRARELADDTLASLPAEEV